MAVHTDVYFPFDQRARAAADLSALPVERVDGDGPEVMEKYVLDDKGIVTVSIRDDRSGYERSYRLGAHRA